MSSIGRWFLKRCYVKESIVVLQTNMDHCGSCGDLTEYKNSVKKIITKNNKDEQASDSRDDPTSTSSVYEDYWYSIWRRCR